MAFSPAAKVGAVTLATAVAVAAGFMWLTNFSPTKRGYDFRVMYGDVAGLLPGAAVMLMGVKIGKVEAVVPEERDVVVRVHVFDDDTKILESARFKIMSQGIIGEKTLEIFPPELRPPTPDYISAGEVVRGDDPQRLELVMEELTNTFNEFKQSTDPKKFQELFQKTAQNLYETSETVKRLGTRGEAMIGDLGATLSRVDRVLVDADRLLVAASPEDVAGVTRDLRQLSAGLLTTYNSFFGTKRAQAENTQAMRSLYALSRQLEQLAGTLNQTAGAPEVQEDIRQTIRNIRTLTGAVTQASELPKASTFAGVSVKPRLQGVAAHTPTGTGLAGNLGLKASLGENYLNLGIEQIGEGNYLNLAFGDDRVWGPTGFHFGLIRSKIGVGIDYDLTPTVKLTGQLYDPFRPTFRVGTTYFPLTGSPYGLMAQWARTFQTNENFIWLGVEWRPLD